MEIKDLKGFIENLPDDMPVGLLDITTDDDEQINYPLSADNLLIEDCTDNDGEIAGKMLFICFENKLCDDADSDLQFIDEIITDLQKYGYQRGGKAAQMLDDWRNKLKQRAAGTFGG